MSLGIHLSDVRVKLENFVENYLISTFGRREKDTLAAEIHPFRVKFLFEQEVHDLQHNASAIEKVAREQYHLCRDGEVIYIYSE